jgi:hypothetical protein
MTKRSDFREDRDHTTAPDFDDPYEVKLAWQRKVRKAWEAAEKPSDLPFIPLDAPWYCDPYQLSPEQIESQRKRYERRS